MSVSKTETIPNLNTFNDNLKKKNNFGNVQKLAPQLRKIEKSKDRGVLSTHFVLIVNLMSHDVYSYNKNLLINEMVRFT